MRHAPIVPVLTIDGPSGSGKGTVSARVAQALGWRLLDSGALYRAVGYAAGVAGLDLSDVEAVTRCARSTRIQFRPGAEGAAATEAGVAVASVATAVGAAGAPASGDPSNETVQKT